MLIKSICLIEDDSLHAELLQDALAQLLPGAETRWFPTGEAAIAGLMQTLPVVPDLLLCDMRLPMMSGAEVVKTLRRDPQFAGMPIVVLTSDISDDMRGASLASDADAYFSKPLDRRKLSRMIDRGNFMWEVEDLPRNRHAYVRERERIAP